MDMISQGLPLKYLEGRLSRSHDRTSLRGIYDEEAARNPEAAVLYPYPTAYSCMQSTRRRNNPPIPLTLFELGRLIGSEEWAHIFSIDLEDGPESFFRRTIQTEEGTALFFSAQSFLDVAVAGVEEMHLDGTFKCIPAAPPSHQLLTIHIIKYEKSIALAYVLMSCRRQGLYRAVLEVLQEFAPTLQPLLIITDYERALRGSLMEMFPAAEVVGCFFHYASAVWKMCATLGYLIEYRNNEYMKKAIKMTMTLPLLPQDTIEAGLEAVMAWCNDRGIDLRNLFAYIQRFWIRSVTPAGMSVFGLPRRTNNNVEACNKIILAKMGVHPNVFVFLEKIMPITKESHAGHPYSGEWAPGNQVRTRTISGPRCQSA